MFPSIFYNPSHQYHTPSRHASPDHHRHMPFTVVSGDAYGNLDSRAPHAYVHAEASVLDHLERQAELEARRAREREIERQRRLAHLAALEEAQHRQYHQQAVIDAYLHAQARARAQAEAEIQQRERQRQYQERVYAIARAQAIQREREERARMQEIERRREQARQRIFVDELFDSLFGDEPRDVEAASSRQPHAQPRAAPRDIPQQQARAHAASHPAPHITQPKATPAHTRPEATQPSAQRSQARPAIAPASPSSEHEAFEKFLNSFFGVSAPHFARAPAAPFAARPSVPTSAQPEVQKSVESSQPRSTKPEHVAHLKQPPAPPTPTPQVVESAPEPDIRQTDDLTNLLSSVFGIPVNVRRSEEKNEPPSPTVEKRGAEMKQNVSGATVPNEIPSSPPVIERPPSPGPPENVASEKKSEHEEPEDVSEDFRQMVDKVFKDLEKAFGVHVDDSDVPKAEEQDIEQRKSEAGLATSVDSTPPSKESAPQRPPPVESPAPTPASEPMTPIPAPEPIPEELLDQAKEMSSYDERSTEAGMSDHDEEDDEVPSSAAELQSEKAKSAATLIQQKYRRHLARVQRLEKLETLKAKLDKITRGFTFPEHLDFQDPDSGLMSPVSDPVDGSSYDGDERVVPVPSLAFTHNNAPYHAQAQALLGLLVSADAISSDGDQEVRRVRKEFVKEVEGRLAEMERQRSAVWQKQRAAEAGNGGKPTSEDKNAIDSHDVDMEPKSTERGENEPVTDDQGQADTGITGPSTEYTEPETPKAVEPQPTFEATPGDSAADQVPAMSTTPTVQKAAVATDDDDEDAPIDGSRIRCRF
ncbi:hypothetical protein QFC19_000695 [Naganishia cerealis]|uniref:Uncharacterized protein n=1 Tax=Naganishia cerealis TaxID=610337 RepID=A0ACC2WMG0_9TREE|nr:hypothetical protein QFC19_000695 [Naganishia cerealis]